MVAHHHVRYNVSDSEVQEDLEFLVVPHHVHDLRIGRRARIGIIGAGNDVGGLGDDSVRNRTGDGSGTRSGKLSPCCTVLLDGAGVRVDGIPRHSRGAANHHTVRYGSDGNSGENNFYRYHRRISGTARARTRDLIILGGSKSSC